MTKDLNKGVTNISYNLLNLPQQVDILSPLAEARNAYSYSADGEKLRVVKKYNSNFNTSPIIGSAVNVSSMDVTKTTDYVDGKIFENNTLDRILVDGGYIKDGIYYFYETDHLGDNRTVVNQSGTVVERNDYYPFGMQMAHNQMLNQASGSDNKRKFGGKELDVMGGLNLYDSQARSYDPTFGSFTTSDPLAEEDPEYSPYVYCGGNPINREDPDGKFWNYVVGAVAGAAVEYGSQVVANVVTSGHISLSSFTQNIDVADIAVSAVEGAATSGGSAIKSVVAKTAISVGAEYIRNKVDLTTNGKGLTKNINTTTKAIKNTAIGVTVGAISTKANIKVAKTSSSNKAVEKARAAAHSQGKGLTTSNAKKIATEQTVKNQTAKNINKTVTSNANKAVGSSASEITKRKTDNH